MKEQKSLNPIFVKTVTTAFIAVVVFIMGMTITAVTRDVSMFFLTFAVSVFCGVKSFTFRDMLMNEKYETVEGTCVTIEPKLLRRYKLFTIMDEDAVETTYMLSNNVSLKVGYIYKLYFAKVEKYEGYLSDNLPTNGFLGFEKLGKYK